MQFKPKVDLAMSQMTFNVLALGHCFIVSGTVNMRLNVFQVAVVCGELGRSMVWQYAGSQVMGHHMLLGFEEFDNSEQLFLPMIDGLGIDNGCVVNAGGYSYKLISNNFHDNCKERSKG